MLKNGRKSLLTMILVFALTVSGSAVQAGTLLKTVDYENKQEGDVISAVANGAEGDSFAVAEENGNKVGKFSFVSSSAGVKGPSGYLDLGAKTGNIIIEQKLKFEPGENCSVNDMYYQLIVQGKKVNGGAWANVNLMDIYPSKVLSYISGSWTTAQPLSGANTLMPGKWYTVKVGINTDTESFRLYIKGEDMTDWVTVTPPEGYPIRYSSASGAAEASKVDFTQGINRVSYFLNARKNSAGAIYHDDMKIYTAPYIGSDVTPESEDIIEPEYTTGFSVDFENYDEGHAYRINDDLVWATGKTKSGKAVLNSTVVQEGDNKVLEIPFDDVASQENMVNYFNFGTLMGKVVLKNRVKFSANMTNKAGSIKYFIGNYDKDTYLPNCVAKNRPVFYLQKNAICGYDQTADVVINKPFEDDKWYDVAFVMDTDAGTWDCYRKEAAASTWERVLPKEQVYNLRNDDSQSDYKTNGISYIGVKAQAINTSDTNKKSVYLDDISFKAVGDAEWTASVTPSNGAENVSIDTNKAVIDFSESMNPLTLTTDNIKLYEADTEIAYDRKISNGNTRYEIPVNGLKNDTVYTVKISNNVTNIYGAAYADEITSSFRTEAVVLPTELTVTDLTFEEVAAGALNDCPNGGVRARASMYNPEEDEKVTALYLVMYGENGKLVSIRRATCAMKQDTVGKSMVVTPYPTENKDGYKIYAYVWMRDSLMPLKSVQYK